MSIPKKAPPTFTNAGMAISECSIIVSSGIICKNGQLKGENILLASRYDDTIEIVGFLSFFPLHVNYFTLYYNGFAGCNFNPAAIN
jgi:hypothetical protein